MRVLLGGLSLVLVAGLLPVALAGGASGRSSTTPIVTFRTPRAVAVCGSTRFRGERPILRCNAQLGRLPPKPDSCGFDWGGGLTMDNAGRPEVNCASDAGYSPYGAPVLAYGRVWHHFTFTCWSHRTGLTCSNPSGHGWFISRNSWRRF